MGDAPAGTAPVTLSIAIEFLALLGYPESAKRRAAATAAMRAYYLRCCRDAGTLEHLGDIMAPQHMQNQLRRLKHRLEKRLIAANDCVALDMGLSRTKRGPQLSLNDIAVDRPPRYKSDWWRPEVMHLAIALRAVMLTWTDPRPFTVETLLLLWPDWIDSAMGDAVLIANADLLLLRAPRSRTSSAALWLPRDALRKVRSRSLAYGS